MDFPYPFFQVQFTTAGDVFDQNETATLMSALAPGANAPTDLFIMSHGWNNNMDEAKSLYSGLSGFIQQQVAAKPALASRKYAILGVLWPSKKFEEQDLIPSGAASLNEAVTTEDLKARVRDLRVLYTASDWPSGKGPDRPEFAEIESLMDSVEDDPAAQSRAVDLLRSLLPQGAASRDDGSQRFFETRNSKLIDNLSRSLNPPPIKAGSSAASLDPFTTGRVSGLGGAAGFRDVLGGIKSGFLHLLNFSTYYLMKARAGDVGVKGLSPLIARIRGARQDLRLHMIGHSFGCRLTSAAINAGIDDERFRPDTVLLLQGAFSHNGFAVQSDNTDRGIFRDVIEKKKVRGPILITHTRNDKAVGIAYAIASRIAGVNAAAIGDENDIFGGLGSNGAQTAETTPERVVGSLLAVGIDYPFAAGVKPSTPYNLRADNFITGHSDIQNPQVAHALATGMAAPVVEAARP
jgi:hypothetical protein